MLCVGFLSVECFVLVLNEAKLYLTLNLFLAQNATRTTQNTCFQTNKPTGQLYKSKVMEHLST
eukprot:m.80477 g.80477  ORF g.80477 m.80477 type:complete len:63 (-) comp14210_c0_seq2:2319-2507(-)